MNRKCHNNRLHRVNKKLYDVNKKLYLLLAIGALSATSCNEVVKWECHFDGIKRCDPTVENQVQICHISRWSDDEKCSGDTPYCLDGQCVGDGTLPIASDCNASRDTKRCNGNTVEVCKVIANGVNRWEKLDTCAGEKPVCDPEHFECISDVTDRPCGETAHGTRVCNENRILVCNNGEFKETEACAPRTSCNNDALECLPVDCNTGELICAGTQYQICINESWADAADLPTDIVVCTGNAPADGSEELPTCQNNGAQTSYCDDTVKLNCALYDDGKVRMSSCGEGFVCDPVQHECVLESCDASETNRIRCLVGNKYQTCDGVHWQLPRPLPEAVKAFAFCSQGSDPNEPGLMVCSHEGRACGDGFSFSCTSANAEMTRVSQGYCDDNGRFVKCEDDTWQTPEVCGDLQICSADGCRDGNPCAGVPHGSNACADNTRIMHCDDGELKEIETCTNRTTCNNTEVTCESVTCITGELACKGTQYQLCVNDKWSTPADLPTDIATCTAGADEVPTCDASNLTSSYCDATVSLNCALYQDGKVSISTCGEGMICSDAHTCIPEPCTPDELNHVRCKLDKYQICDGTSWSIPAAIPESVKTGVTCRQEEDPDVPGIIVCKDEGRYCGDSHTFTCTAENAEVVVVTAGYCNDDGAFVGCANNEWADPDVCDARMVCSEEGCRNGKDCGDLVHKNRLCSDDNRILECDDGKLNELVVCSPRTSCHNDSIVCLPVDCNTGELACAGSQYQICVNDKWAAPADLPTDIATCTTGDDEVPTCDDAHSASSYCNATVSLNCALSNDGKVKHSTCGEGFVCDNANHACIQEPCTTAETGHVRCNIDKFQVCDGEKWSLPATLTDRMKSIVRCNQDSDPAVPGKLECEDVGTACNDSLEISCSAVSQIIDVSTCGNSMVCDAANEICIPEPCAATDDNHLRCSSDLKQICKDGVWQSIETILADLPADLLNCGEDDKIECVDDAVHCTDSLVLTCENTHEPSVTDSCASGLICRTDTHSCVECTEDRTDNCSGDKPVCNPATNVCVGCLSDSDCAGSTVCDNTTNTCITCRNNEVSCRIVNGKPQYSVCHNQTWSESKNLPVDVTNALLSCTEPFDENCSDDTCDRKLLCKESNNNYCGSAVDIFEDLAIQCDAAGTFPTIDSACENILENRQLCNDGLHKCVECHPGQIRCAGAGKYKLCDNFGAWSTAMNLPAEASAHLKTCTGDEPLECSGNTGSFCDTSLAFNCNVTPGPTPIEHSTCGSTYTCDNTNNVCVCSENDIMCDNGNYKICRSGIWESFNPASELPNYVVSRMLESIPSGSCTTEPICKITDSYCDDSIVVTCVQGEPPQITPSCPSGYACQYDTTDSSNRSNKCVLQPIETCEDSKCPAPKKCVVSSAGKEICVYHEDFEYDFWWGNCTQQFTQSHRGKDGTAITDNYSECNSYNFDIITQCAADNGYNNGVGPGWRAERDIDRGSWKLHAKARKLLGNASRTLDGTQHIGLMSRGEEEPLVCKWRDGSQTTIDYSGRYWRNHVTLYDFEGGVGVLSFEWRNQSRTLWDAMVCNETFPEMDCPYMGTPRHVGKLRFFVNDIEDFAVAEMPYHTQLLPQRYEIDFSTLTLPAGLTAGEIKKITIRPEYRTFLGDGQAESLIGQIFIDNIRWSSAEE